jgi:hypothetical protein
VILVSLCETRILREGMEILGCKDLYENTSYINTVLSRTPRSHAAQTVLHSSPTPLQNLFVQILHFTADLHDLPRTYCKSFT